jgi:hypothetical protein
MTNVPVDLHSEEKDHWVSEWIAEGRVPSLPQGLATDSNGRISITGLPNGPFRWRVILADGSAVEGIGTVPPHGAATVTVSVP